MLRLSIYAQGLRVIIVVLHVGEVKIYSSSAGAQEKGNTR
jgi:hypothetical protein